MLHKEVTCRPDESAEKTIEQIKAPSQCTLLNPTEDLYLLTLDDISNEKIQALAPAVVAEVPANISAQAPAAADTNSSSQTTQNRLQERTPWLYYLDNSELKEVADIPELFYLNTKGVRCVEHDGELRAVGSYSSWYKRRHPDAYPGEAVVSCKVQDAKRTNAGEQYFLDNDKRELVPAGLVQLKDNKTNVFVYHNGKNRPVGANSKWRNRRNEHVKTKRTKSIEPVANPDGISLQSKFKTAPDPVPGALIFSIYDPYHDRNLSTLFQAASTSGVKRRKDEDEKFVVQFPPFL